MSTIFRDSWSGTFIYRRTLNERETGPLNFRHVRLHGQIDLETLLCLLKSRLSPKRSSTYSNHTTITFVDEPSQRTKFRPLLRTPVF